MNSIKTKTNNYFVVAGKAIAGMLIIPSGNKIMAYVVWEWCDQADEKFFAITGTFVENPSLTMPQLITHVADYGVDMTGIKEVRVLFPHIFK